jgi:hypothetical protein
VMISRSSSGGGGGAHLPPAHHLFSNWQFRNVEGMVTTRRGRRWRVKKKEEKDSSTAAGVVREEEDMGTSPMQLMLLPDFDSTMVCNLSSPPSPNQSLLLSVNSGHNKIMNSHRIRCAAMDHSVRVQEGGKSPTQICNKYIACCSVLFTTDMICQSESATVGRMCYIHGCCM